ncbi:MAG: hypothetical protein ACRD0J_08695 [Acidimicrobiales bacterium]
MSTRWLARAATGIGLAIANVAAWRHALTILRPVLPHHLALTAIPGPAWDVIGILALLALAGQLARRAAPTPAVRHALTERPEQPVRRPGGVPEWAMGPAFSDRDRAATQAERWLAEGERIRAAREQVAA